MKLIAIYLALLFSGCASMQQYIHDNYCNYEGAYTVGMNDANSGAEMNAMPAAHCPEATKAEVRRGYREGYTNGNRGRSSKVYNKECHQDFGERICGYNCIHSFGHWYCADGMGDNCIESYGIVRCGSNCRKEFGEIRCD